MASQPSCSCSGSSKPSEVFKRECEQEVADGVALAVIDRFNALPGRGKPQGRAWTVLAGIVVEDERLRQTPAKRLRVLALATGTRCIGVAAMAAARGGLVHDCHAEVLCRRAFNRYLFSELAARSRDEGGSDNTSAHILEPFVAAGASAEATRETSRWRLRQGLRLHFYVSTLPCGECTLVPIHTIDEGTLKRAGRWQKLEQESRLARANAPIVPLQDRNRTGAKPSIGMPLDPKTEGIGFHCSGILRYKSGRSDTLPEARSVCYSCSDKICRWNHIGWQGALLSRLLDGPLTVSTIVIGGGLFDKDFIRAALFDRAVGTATDETKGFTTTVRCPTLCATSVAFANSREVVEDRPVGLEEGPKVSTAGLCIVWAAPCPRSRAEQQPLMRSISSKVPGFYEVLIGHTGERQGLKHDRQGAKESWVSPLSKRLMAEAIASSLIGALGSTAAASSWLLAASCPTGAAHCAAIPTLDSRGAPLMDGSAAKKQRLLEGAAGTVDAPGSGPLLYAWLKEAMASDDYRERKRHFHKGHPFAHWRRKANLTFCADSGWNLMDADTSSTSVDDFPVHDLNFVLDRSTQQ